MNGDSAIEASESAGFGLRILTVYGQGPFREAVSRATAGGRELTAKERKNATSLPLPCSSFDGAYKYYVYYVITSVIYRIGKAKTKDPPSMPI
jgi:hypothetical protein